MVRAAGKGCGNYSQELANSFEIDSSINRGSILKPDVFLNSGNGASILVDNSLEGMNFDNTQMELMQQDP